MGPSSGIYIPTKRRQIDVRQERHSFIPTYLHARQAKRMFCPCGVMSWDGGGSIDIDMTWHGMAGGAAQHGGWPVPGEENVPLPLPLPPPTPSTESLMAMAAPPAATMPWSTSPPTSTGHSRRASLNASRGNTPLSSQPTGVGKCPSEYAPGGIVISN